MLSIVEGSFEVFVVFQRAPRGNSSLFHTRMQSDTHVCVLLPTTLTLRVNGRESIKQHSLVCITGHILAALMARIPLQI